MPEMIGPALDPELHTVIAHAHDLGQAVLHIAAMGDGRLHKPDVVIVGGMLEGELEYTRSPVVITRQERVMKQGWLRAPREVTENVHTTLLPVYDQDGAVVLPVRRGSAPKPGDVYARTQYYQTIGAKAGFVLSHLTRILLPDAGLISISSNNPWNIEGLPVDAYIDRDAFASARVREALDRLLADRA